MDGKSIKKGDSKFKIIVGAFLFILKGCFTKVGVEIQNSYLLYICVDPKYMFGVK